MKVVNYLFKTYGYEHTANIVTFDRFGVKQSLRDCAKALSVSERDLSMLMQTIPSGAKTLAQAYETSEKMRTLVESSPSYRKLMQAAVSIEGLPRHTSIHAAGVVLSSLPLKDVVPLVSQDHTTLTTQFTKDYLEQRGLIKMDVLGLRNLSIISEILESLRKQGVDLDLMKIDKEDQKTYALFAAGNTNGVFQFESDGMKALLRKMVPASFEELIAALALYRPGPKDNIPLYLENEPIPKGLSIPLKARKIFSVKRSVSCCIRNRLC